jgi:probable F420-dependent oxidoreductase
MKIGFAVPDSGAWATPANQIRIARRAEELGYHSVWTLQRLLNPAGSTDRTYSAVPDPLITLAYLAGHTSRIRLGVAVVNMPFYSPALLAKQAATLDQVSGGRLDLGLGLGWMPEEYAAAGVPMARRGARANEFLTVLRGLFSGEITSYDGEFHTFPPVRMDLRPVQTPHPPLLIGGLSPAALRRAGRLGDGWVSSSRADLATMGQSIKAVRDAAAEAGRDPAALRFVCRGVVKVRGTATGGRRDGPLTGTYDQIRDDFAQLAGQGLTEVFADLNFDPEIGAPHADPAVSMRRAEEALAALTPAG